MSNYTQREMQLFNDGYKRGLRASMVLLSQVIITIETATEEEDQIAEKSIHDLDAVHHGVRQLEEAAKREPFQDVPLPITDEQAGLKNG